jgi:mRNA-degrading endonuclease RelE of RelBE toxin-antitoxin system
MKTDHAYEVQLDRLAEVALVTLPEQDRGRVTAAIERLRGGPNPPGVPQSYRVRGRDQSLYVLRSDPWRLLYRVEGERTIRVVDIVNHDFVRQYFHSAAG